MSPELVVFFAFACLGYAAGRFMTFRSSNLRSYHRGYFLGMARGVKEFAPDHMPAIVAIQERAISNGWIEEYYLPDDKGLEDV